MFRRKKAVDLQRECIAQGAKELVPFVGDRVEWVSPLLGRFTLQNLDIEKREAVPPPYYELRAGLRVDPKIDRFPHELFVFIGSGTIVGVVRNLAQPHFTDEAVDEFISSTNFQIDNSLTAPDSEDYSKLALYLKNGKLDKV